MTSPEQLKPPSEAFIIPLLELRNYYASMVQEYQKLFIEARSQLDHVEALLSSWSYSDDHEPISELEDDQVGSQLFLASNHQSTLESFTCKSLEHKNLDLEQKEVFPETPEPITDAIKPTVILPSEETHKSFRKGEEVPMIAQYKSLNRMGALRLFFDEHAGTACHIDFILRSIYGNLEPAVLRIVKGRLQSSLTQGREKGDWYAVPNEPGCYTLALNLLDYSRPSLSSASHAKKKKSVTTSAPPSTIIPLLKQFEGQFVVDAISLFLEQHRGQIFTVNEVIQGIYGNLDDQQIAQIKNKTLNELSRGHRTGRFSRVPNKVGFYTWNANLLPRDIWSLP
jgi:hypothetical protein